MRHAADLCTALRIVLAPLFAWQLALPRERGGSVALAVFVLAAATDYLDGALARAVGTASPRGRVFDHGADALLLFPAFLVLAAAGRLPFVLPVAAMVAFGLYLLDGWRVGELAASRSGALGGVLNYALAGTAAAAAAFDLLRLDPVIAAAAYGIAAVNATAAVERLSRLVLTSAPGSPAARTGCRAPRSSA
jgi:CDP-diacylglycerol--glycerol-3-phosphate 3-phosphatidyltransferase